MEHVEGQTNKLILILYNHLGIKCCYRTEPCFVRAKDISGLTTVDALGAIQLAGATLAVEISNLLAGGFQT